MPYFLEAQESKGETRRCVQMSTVQSFTPIAGHITQMHTYKELHQTLRIATSVAFVDNDHI